MSTAAQPDCLVCARKTPLHCASCHHSPFCGVECHKILAATHPWLCGQPAGTFTFAPLTTSEKAQLDAAYTSANVEMKQVWRESLVMQDNGWKWSAFPTLFSQLTLGTCSIAEPGRSAMIAELHYVLVRARSLRVTPPFVLSLWGYTALSARWLLEGCKRPDNANDFPSYQDASLADIVPILHRLLVYWTVASPALTGFAKASVKRVKKHALERVEASAQDLALGTAEEKKQVGRYARAIVETASSVQ
ncbi:hypothetical protein JCM10449v2_001583 [Rhodotorula kratochvilovae]